MQCKAFSYQEIAIQFDKLYKQVPYEWRWDPCQSCLSFLHGEQSGRSKAASERAPRFPLQLRQAASTSAIMLAPEAQPAAAGPRVRLS